VHPQLRLIGTLSCDYPPDHRRSWTLGCSRSHALIGSSVSACRFQFRTPVLQAVVTFEIQSRRCRADGKWLDEQRSQLQCATHWAVNASRHSLQPVWDGTVGVHGLIAKHFWELRQRRAA